MNIFFTDTVAIIPTTQDEWSKLTKGAEVITRARVEDFNNLIVDQNGNEVMADMLVLLPKTAEIKYNYFIRIKTKNGNAFIQNMKDFRIKKIYEAGMLKRHHIEVYL